MGGRWRVEMARERPAVMSRGWRIWWVVVGVEDLDVREEERRRWVAVGVYGATGEGGGMGKK
jgi:hypothetical protein